MEKLLAIASLGQRAYGRWLFQRLMSGIIVVTGLTIIISIMIGTMLVGGLYAGYSALLHYGIQPQVAMIIIGVSAILITITLVILTLSCLSRLRQMPRTLLKQSPLTSCAMDALDAFSNGLMAD